MKRSGAGFVAMSVLGWACGGPTASTSVAENRAPPPTASSAPATGTTVAAPPTATATTPPLAIPPPQPRTLGCGLGDGCALDAEGRAYCWGSWDLTPKPGKSRGALVAGVPKARTLAVGASHACALTVDGEVWCWGAGSYGELGDGFAIATDGSGRISHAARRAVRARLPSKATELAAGTGNTCAILADQTVACWGEYVHGVLGDATAPSSTPRVVPRVTGAVELAVGEDQACARQATGDVWCWGEIVTGRTIVPPTHLEGLCARQITVGTGFGYALACDGSLRGWGLAPGAPLRESFAVTAVADAPAGLVEVRAAYAHACARDNAGAVWCWGHNASGQLGNPQVSDGIAIETSPSPVKAGAARVKARALCTGGMNVLNRGGYKSGARYVEGGATCVGGETGDIECWGEPARTATPVRVAAPSGR